MTGPGLQNIILALAYKEWVIPCRVVRGETLAAREVEYVEAARAMGGSSRYIMLREILPNILSPVFVVSTVRMPHVIRTEARSVGKDRERQSSMWGASYKKKKHKQ